MPNIPAAFRRTDESPDELFYQTPRLVTHIDDDAIAAVTQLYREYFPVGGAILDLMSSWISHLPPEIDYCEVVGLGMNAPELAANPRLTEFRVQNLNVDPKLPYETGRFDGAAICVSIDYLTDPEAVLREAARVLKLGAPMVVTFSNRCFPTKAVAAWHALDEPGRVRWVVERFERAGGWGEIDAFDRSPANARGRRTGDPLYAVVARRL